MNNHDNHNINPSQNKTNIYFPSSITTTPTPYPYQAKIDRINIKHSPNNNTSNAALVKRELNTVETKYISLQKNYDKLQSKFKEQIEESKLYKAQNEFLSKEVMILQKTNDKIIAEKFSLEAQLEENKGYTRKIETKLVNGAKNQFLIEINSKLKDEITQLNTKISKAKDDIDSLNTELKSRDKEIKILHKAIEIKAEDLQLFQLNKKKEKDNDGNNNKCKEKKINTNVNGICDVLYNIGIFKEEKDTLKKNNDNLIKINQEIEHNNLQLKSKNDELSFSIQHLTSLIANHESQITIITEERDFFKKTLNTIQQERNTLREIIDSKGNEQKAIETDIQNEVSNYIKTINKLNTNLKHFEASCNDSIIEISLLKNNLNTMTIKYNSLEQSYKEKTEEAALNQATNDCNSKLIKEQKDQIEQLNTINKRIEEMLHEVNDKLHLIEKENIDLIAKNKSMIITYEQTESDLIKQNQSLTYNEMKHREQLEKLNKEIEIFRNERDQFKQIMNTIESKSKNLIKEKSEIEQHLNYKTIQIQRLKNNNDFLQKNLSNTLHTNNNNNNNNSDSYVAKTEEEKSANNISILNENDSMMSKLRKERDKNKNIMSEIRKLKGNIKDMNTNQRPIEHYSQDYYDDDD